MSQAKIPQVGIGITIFKEDKVLLGRRKGSHGEGQYAWPGGHLEYMESLQDCARREVREETGMEIDNIRFIRVFNCLDYAPKHYLDIALAADWVSGDPKVLEPERCEAWAWYTLDNLPQPLFEFVKITVDALKTGRNFYD